MHDSITTRFSGVPSARTRKTRFSHRNGTRVERGWGFMLFLDKTPETDYLGMETRMREKENRLTGDLLSFKLWECVTYSENI